MFRGVAQRRIGQAKALVAIQRRLIFAPELTPSDRARFWLEGWSSVLLRRSSVEYLGHAFAYDGRFIPLLLPAYLEDIARLNAIVPLRNADVIDIGANVGQFGATIARRFPATRIWSFEPNKDVFSRLQRNAQSSPHWITVPWGVANQDQEASLWVAAGHSPQGSLYPVNAQLGLPHGSLAEHRVELRCLTPARCRSLGIPSAVDLVKIDVEGAEREALMGLTSVSWRYLAIETSLHREGGMSVQETGDLCKQIWGRRPEVVWASTPKSDSATVEAILSMPAV